jgi:hypothetical protein
MMIMYLLMKVEPGVRTLASEHLRVDAVPQLAGRALRITHLESGQDVTAYNTKRSLFFPFCGGLEDRVGDGFPPFGWVEPSFVLLNTPRKLVTLLFTMDGFNIQRTMTLDPDEPILRIESRLTNPKDRAATVRLRSHLELDLGELRSTRVRYTNLDGVPMEEDLTEVIDAMREGVRYFEGETPSGSWTFSGSKGLQVTQRFDNEDLEYTWLYSYPEYLNELEIELWAKRVELKPGESVTITQELEVRPAE